MTLEEIARLLNARVLTEQVPLDSAVHGVYSSDMLSDVLKYGKEQSALVTGLVNIQVVRTAMMLDMHGIIFVSGKEPEDDVISLAEENGIALLLTSLSTFKACGILYAAGVSGENG